MRVYLDNSVLNRPGDDQKQARIWMETLAFSLILGLIESGQLEMVRSVKRMGIEVTPQMTLAKPVREAGESRPD